MSFASVLIARYLVATGRRAAAIAKLAAHAAGYQPQAVHAELDVLDAVDALGDAARDAHLPWYDVGRVASALARRRRFDLLRPLLDRVHEKPDHTWPTVTDALEGLWAAPAIADDSVLVRDWLLPIAEPYARGECARFLALVGDTEMARSIADEQRAAAAATGEIDRARLLAWIAPAVAALGEYTAAAAMVGEAGRLWDEVFDEDLDGYGVPLRDTIDEARMRVAHVAQLVANRALPWYPQHVVSNTFTGFSSYGRFGPDRERYEETRHAIDYLLAARDLPALFAVLERARVTDPDDAPRVLAKIAEQLPRASIDHTVAMQLSAAAYALTDPQRQDGGAKVIAALAEAGHLDRARALVPHVDTIYTRPGFYARLGAQLVPHDRAAGLAYVQKALGAHGDEQELAEFVVHDQP